MSRYNAFKVLREVRGNCLPARPLTRLPARPPARTPLLRLLALLCQSVPSASFALSNFSLQVFREVKGFGNEVGTGSAKLPAAAARAVSSGR